MYNWASLFRVALSQYGKVFGLPSTLVALLVLCVNALPNLTKSTTLNTGYLRSCSRSCTQIVR